MQSDDPLPSYDFLKGATLLVDKPYSWTSFDVVNKIRSLLRHKLGVKKIKVGHSGTLDPMATGLLIICTGKFTKKLHDYQGLPKEYTGTIQLGATTPSYDAESEIDEYFPIDHITEADIERARQQFIGVLDQVPPMFSAIKVDGQPLYKRARKGEHVAIQPRRVEISRFDITATRMPEVDFLVQCSKGTYIRSLAQDFGKALRSGAYLNKLCRTKIGDFELKDAWKLEDLVSLLSEDRSPLNEPNS